VRSDQICIMGLISPLPVRGALTQPAPRQSDCEDTDARTFGLSRALCGAPSFGIQGRPRPSEFSVRVHGCSHPFIGHPLDTSKVFRAKYLISLALPRGLEPLFSL
jgi:hypothetical protein